MPDALHLRRFQPDDAPVLIDLFRETVRRVNSRDYTAEQVAAWAPDDMNPARWSVLSERFTIVAESGSSVVGFTDLEPDGHIDRFFVHADWQGQGVGKAMLSELKTEAQRTALHRLYAEVSITARPFFLRQGFIVRAEQIVHVRGVPMINYRMEHQL
jgi:putative acetyltransferase